jgi:hypothetical protein
MAACCAMPARASLACSAEVMSTTARQLESGPAPVGRQPAVDAYAALSGGPWISYGSKRSNSFLTTA